MADLDKKQNGASPVDQTKDMDNMIEDASNNRDKYISDLEKDLDRGQELYTGFGFGSVDAGSTNLAETSKTQPIHKVSDENNPEKVVNVSNINRDGSKVFEADGAGIARDNDKKVRVDDDKNIAPKAKVNNDIVSHREVPEDTKVVIEPDNGDVVYTETSVDARVQKPKVVVEEETSNTKSYHGVDLPIDKESAVDVPSDYQLAGVYYGNDFREDNRSYLVGPYQTDAYSIKRHYKSQAKYKKNGLPIKKIALGVAAIAGVVWFMKDDDKRFWN